MQQRNGLVNQTQLKSYWVLLGMVIPRAVNF